MYIIISLFFVYAIGVISYEFGFFSYMFIFVFASLIYNSYHTKKYIYNIVIILFLILSFINCYYNSISNLTQYIDSDIEIVVRIKDENKSDSNYSSYNATILSIDNAVLLDKENTIIYIDKIYDVKENSIIKANVNVADTSFSKNMLLFNYKNYLRSKKISAVAFTEGNITTLKENYSYLNEVSISFRNYSENTFYNSLSHKNADIVLSILLGNIDYLDENFYDNIKIMGIAHIFAVSGTHIVLLYAFLLTVFKYCGLKRRARHIITWLIIWFYGFLIGFPISVMRTLVMFTLLFSAEIFYRKYNSLNAIGLAALILTIYNPFWLFDAGFLLSFSAALSLIVYNKYISKNVQTKNSILKLIYLYLFLMLFTLPVLAYFFNYIPVMGTAYNIILLPIFTILMIYGFVLLIFNGFIPYLFVIPFKIFDYLLYSLRYFINFTEAFGFNGLTIQTMSVSLIIYFYIMIIFMIYVYNNNNLSIKKCGSYILIFFYLVTFINPVANDYLYFNVVDAGQGLFTYIKYKNTNFIVDCGSSNNKNFGEYTVVPYFIKRGINSIDGVFISHWDNDHYSGLNDLLNSNISIGNIFAPSDNKEFKRDISILKKGNSYSIDDLKIDILWPEKNYIGKTNNTSLVLLVNVKNKNILFAGDIEEEIENIIIDHIPKIDILVVPHHGSKTSSSNKFVYKTTPEIAVFSYGKNNYGIPSKEVIERYENEKSIILSTFEQGEINFVLKNSKIHYNTYINTKSKNYYELYYTGMILKLMVFFMLLIYMTKYRGENYEL